ncbi:MAG: PAS domain-containing protein [Chromatiaceae bacterium]|nr:PAS domain-containing protein [Chromatiaceae bacterium]
MQAPDTPQNETLRLQALADTTLLDTPTEPRFERLTALVKQCLHTDIVLISLVDSERQWFKSRQGLDACETGRDISFCGHAILSDDILEVPDALLDSRFADNPLVTGAPFIRFYAGAPLKFRNQRIGTLCIIEPAPRTLSTDEKLILRKFADAIEQEITDRLQEHAEQELQASRDQFRALVDNIPGITYRCKADKDWTMLYMSSSIDPLSGYPASDFINNKVRSYASVIHPDDQARLEVEVDKAVTSRRNWLLQYRVVHKSGAIHWVEERGQAEYDKNGDVVCLDGFILDITEEKSLKQQLLKLTSQLPGVVYQYQQWPDGRLAFPYASDNIIKIYGVRHEQVKQDASVVFNRIVPEDLPGLAKSIEVSAANLSVWQYQYRVLDEQGQTRWLSGQAMPERMPDGSTLWHGYLEDITNVKQYYLALERVNKELKLSQERLDEASETAQMGFWQANVTSGNLWWSPVVYTIFGLDERSEPSVAIFKSMVHPEDRDLVAQSEQRAEQTGLHDVVHRIIRPDGSIRWVHELAKLLPSEQGADHVLVGSVQDVTERIQLQQLKDQFISTVSHELRTPLTAIKGALGLVNSGKLGVVPDAVAKLLFLAQSNTERLTQLINDLLDMEKLVAGKMPFHIEKLAINNELEYAVESIKPYALQHHVDIQIIPQDKVLVMADSLRLQQVLTNLLSNAIKFSHAEAKVTLQTNISGDKVKITVTDTGQGIAPEFQPRVFERFAQADGSNLRKATGTGLGLAICKELISQMHGEIGFVSELGKGTSFFFTLPLWSGKANESSDDKGYMQ